MIMTPTQYNGQALMTIKADEVLWYPMRVPLWTRMEYRSSDKAIPGGQGHGSHPVRENHNLEMACPSKEGTRLAKCSRDYSSVSHGDSHLESRRQEA